jgi:hypothetical protein
MNGYPEGPETTRRHRELSRRFLAEQLSHTARPVILLDRWPGLASQRMIEALLREEWSGVRWAH